MEPNQPINNTQPAAAAAPVQQAAPTTMGPQFSTIPSSSSHVGMKIAIAIIVIVALAAVAYFTLGQSKAPAPALQSNTQSTTQPKKAARTVNPEDASMAADLRAISNSDSNQQIDSINAEFK